MQPRITDSISYNLLRQALQRFKKSRTWSKTVDPHQSIRMSHQNPELMLDSFAVRYDSKGSIRDATTVPSRHSRSSVSGSIHIHPRTSSETPRETSYVGASSWIKYSAHGSLRRIRGTPGCSLTPHTSNYSLERLAADSQCSEEANQEKVDKRATCSTFSWANLSFVEETPGKLPGEEFSALKEQYERECVLKRTRTAQEKVATSVYHLELLYRESEYEKQCRQQLHRDVRELTENRIIMAETEAWYENNYNDTQGFQNMQEKFDGRMPAINKGWLDRMPDGKHTTPVDIPGRTLEQFNQRWHEDDLKHELAQYYADMGLFAPTYQSQHVQAPFQCHADVTQMMAHRNEYQRLYGPGTDRHLPSYREDENGRPVPSFNFSLPPQTPRAHDDSVQSPPIILGDLSLQDRFSNDSDSDMSCNEHSEESTNQSRFSVDSSIVEANARSMARRTRNLSRELKSKASKILRE